jgi:ankyrin repeat protein
MENSKTAELLIEKGASVNALTTGNQTPLHWAAQSENSIVSRLLILNRTTWQKKCVVSSPI